MERTRLTFEKASSRPGELVRGVVMIETTIDMRAARFEARAEGVEKVPVVVSVGHLGGPAEEERRVFEIPLLLELLHAPEGFGRTEDGLILLPKGVYFLGFAFRVPGERQEAGSAAASEVRVGVLIEDETGIEVETSASLPALASPRDIPSTSDPLRRLALL